MSFTLYTKVSKTKDEEQQISYEEFKVLTAQYGKSVLNY